MDLKYCSIEFCKKLIYDGYTEDVFIIQDDIQPNVQFDVYEMSTFMSHFINARRIIKSTTLVEFTSEIVCERYTGETFIFVAKKIGKHIEMVLYGFDKSDCTNPKKTHAFRFDTEDDVFELLKRFVLCGADLSVGKLKIEYDV